MESLPMAALFRDDHIALHQIDRSLIAACSKCGTQATLHVDDFLRFSRAEAVDHMDRWMRSFEAEHAHAPPAPTKCDGAENGCHSFFGFDPGRRCACGMTEAEALVASEALWRERAPVNRERVKVLGIHRRGALRCQP